MTQIIAQGKSLDDLKAAANTAVELPPGSAGQVVVEGPGLGVAADVVGAETAWRTIMGRYGLEVTDVHGDGLNKAIVEWRVPSGAAHSQSPCGCNQVASMGMAQILIVGAVLAVLLFLGWLIIRQVTILLTGGAGGGFPWIPVLLISGVILLLTTPMGKRLKEKVLR